MEYDIIMRIFKNPKIKSYKIKERKYKFSPKLQYSAIISYFSYIRSQTWELVESM